MVTKKKITITDENYLEIMELIYNYPSEFIGKKISYEGFVYQTPNGEQEDSFYFVSASFTVSPIQEFWTAHTHARWDIDQKR